MDKNEISVNLRLNSYNRAMYRELRDTAIEGLKTRFSYPCFLHIKRIGFLIEVAKCHGEP